MPAARAVMNTSAVPVRTSSDPLELLVKLRVSVGPAEL